MVWGSEFGRRIIFKREDPTGGRSPPAASEFVGAADRQPREMWQPAQSYNVGTLLEYMPLEGS